MKTRIFKAITLLLFAFFLTGCENSKSSEAGIDTGSYFQRGIASWYGGKYHNKKTASGEIFNKNEMTAAHKELAFNTWVEVSNLDNGRRTRVRITDRGPYVEGRIIDLSERAADEIGIKTAGLAEVTLKIVEGP